MTTEAIAQLFDLTGKAAIVTGGAMGIGQSIAFRLAEAGASVMITDINSKAAKQTVEAIKAKGGRAQAIRADASSIADAKEVAQAAVRAFGRIDILVNNAGVYPISPVLQMTEDEWDKVLNVVLKGTFFHSQAAAVEMVKAGQGGKIINISSIDALHPSGLIAHYNAAKAGVAMLTKALALELAPYKILVNAVLPGAVYTPGVQSMIPALATATGIAPEDLRKSLLARIPLGRDAEPDDIAKVVLFLASAAADYMTGSLVVVDGGQLQS
jgi:2-deoxy-D-gluconate 3-dehydrogenase